MTFRQRLVDFFAPTSTKHVFNAVEDSTPPEVAAEVTRLITHPAVHVGLTEMEKRFGHEVVDACVADFTRAALKWRPTRADAPTTAKSRWEAVECKYSTRGGVFACIDVQAVPPPTLEDDWEPVADRHDDGDACRYVLWRRRVDV